MAADTKARMSISMYDNIGGKSTFLVHGFIDGSTTVAAAGAALATLATAVGTVSTGGISEATLTVINTAVAAAPAADAAVASGAVFDFVTAAGPNRFGLYVPSWLDSLTGSGGHIDITAGVPAAFVASILAAVDGGHYTNNAFVAFSAGQSAFLSNRKRRERVR